MKLIIICIYSVEQLEDYLEDTPGLGKQVDNRTGEVKTIKMIPAMPARELPAHHHHHGPTHLPFSVTEMMT